MDMSETPPTHAEAEHATPTKQLEIFLRTKIPAIKRQAAGLKPGQKLTVHLPSSISMGATYAQWSGEVMSQVHRQLVQICGLSSDRICATQPPGPQPMSEEDIGDFFSQGDTEKPPVGDPTAMTAEIHNALTKTMEEHATTGTSAPTQPESKQTEPQPKQTSAQAAAAALKLYSRRNRKKND